MDGGHSALICACMLGLRASKSSMCGAAVLAEENCRVRQSPPAGLSGGMVLVLDSCLAMKSTPRCAFMLPGDWPTIIGDIGSIDLPPMGPWPMGGCTLTGTDAWKLSAMVRKVLQVGRGCAADDARGTVGCTAPGFGALGA
mmetsp:Transcript_74726/g.228636  ORF Transcript_74726/g.228636 Transcript_74726/m.228636 type:complete len:141 (+) Transcript_74726:989-1411(+)